ncbi:hypothetical protein HO542_01795 [Streptococcus suis]|uniref:hypothetical protein n=1 Tax=Streptococcus suis TaxID=1307 RepID=UPI0015557D28|nr:hypothetical protein [Streptococcus suis]HEM4324982.1 hypothetical protein [Streptococcus suis]HEM6087368.1 hypothetical protein [Streptococcus suis]HEM6104352.1 hypothetical protein [Streptococcus suis]
MKVNRVIFTPRVSFADQGTLKFVLKKWRPEGFFVRELGKGNGNWTIYRPGKIEVEIDDNGEVICLDVTRRVKELYNRKRLTEKFAKDIECDLRTGRLSLDDL